MNKGKEYLDVYYNKFNEEKRFDSRHGQVEYRTSMYYIKQAILNLKEHRVNESSRKSIENSDISILDIGAGTGRYSIPLAEEGYEVHAIELVKHNLNRLKAKCDKVHARLGDALNLSKYANNSFDIVLLFGPMYHLFGVEDKERALMEAKRVLKPDGYLLVAYCMNDYAVVMYGIKEKHLKECYLSGKFTEDFHCVQEPEDLYDYVRLEDINALNQACQMKREKIITPDGPANYIRPQLKEMDDETFEIFMKYHLSNCERPELVGAGGHILDILRKNMD